jgi:hypothetical protein
MKNLLLAAFIIFAAVSAYSQTISFHRTSVSVVQGPADTILDSYGTLNNLTSGNITVRFTLSNMVVPSGWDTIGICTWQNCYGPGSYVIDEVCSPGEHEIHLYVYPWEISGSGSCRVTASHLSTSISEDFGFTANPIGIQQISNVVKEFSLSQNYPNPFNPNTKINFSIPKSDFVSLRVYDMLGREIKVLVNGALTAGEYETDFDAKGLSSGMYYYSLRAGEYVDVKKMVLVK